MRVDELELQRANVTIVYDKLPVNDISLDLFKTIWPDDPHPAITSMPDMMVIMYPARALTISAQNRRLIIDWLLGQTFVPEELAHATQIAAGAVKQGRMIAFGLNYNFRVTLNLKEGQTSVAYLIAKYLRDTDALAKKGGGKLIGVGLDLTFERDLGRLQIGLRPVDPTTITADTNLHFRADSIPPATELATLLAKGRQEVETRIKQL